MSHWVFIYEELQQDITDLSTSYYLARMKRISLSVTLAMVPGTPMEALTSVDVNCHAVSFTAKKTT